MGITQANSLCSYLYVSHFILIFFVFLPQNQRTGELNRFCGVGGGYGWHWGEGGYGREVGRRMK
jgi:hypothetical protein